MNELRAKQAGVAVGMALGAAATAGGFWWALSGPGVPAVAPDGAVRASLFGALLIALSPWLALAITLLARRRFFAPQDIDAAAGAGEGSRAAAILQAVAQNTLEQTALAALVWGGWLMLAPPSVAGLPIVLCAYFWIGRALFFLGYSRGAVARSLGFALTFYPTIALLFAALPLAARTFLAWSR